MEAVGQQTSATDTSLPEKTSQHIHRTESNVSQCQEHTKF